jgi:hypothetical protein
MGVAIDASNIRDGGGRTYLMELPGSSPDGTATAYSWRAIGARYLEIYEADGVIGLWHGVCHSSGDGTKARIACQLLSSAGGCGMTGHCPQRGRV